MDVLQHERKRSLAQIGLARLSHRAGRRIGPERFVVRAAVVVAGEPEAARRPRSAAPRKTAARRATSPAWARTTRDGFAESSGE